MTPPRSQEAASEWLPLGEASKFLGVDESTLRAWTDAGRLRAFRTPGGHRRYRRDDLSAFVQSQQAGSQSTLADVIGPHGVRLMAGASRRGIHQQSWYANVDPATAEAMRLTCRTLMDALAGYLAGGQQQRTALRTGENAGRELGRQVAALRLGPAEATRAFLYFKESITQAVSSRLPLPSDRKIRSIRRIERFLDRVLLQMMAVYEQAH